MIIGQDMELALGLPVYVTSFSDNIPRKCYPFLLEDLHDANMMLSSFDNNNLNANAGNEYKMIALNTLLRGAFRDESDPINLWNGIDEQSFPEIVSDIKIVSGIKDDKGDVDVQKSSESLSWKKGVSAIQIYTANTYKDIQKMTLRQFNNLLEYIGIDINWKYKTGIVGSVKEPEDFLKQEEHPLAPDTIEERKNRMTMKDIQGLADIGR